MTATRFTVGITAAEVFPRFTGASSGQYGLTGDNSVYLYGTPDEICGLAARLIAAAYEAEALTASKQAAS